MGRVRSIEPQLQSHNTELHNTEPGTLLL
ncbi:MAG: hypothetical protein ACI835_002850, partial [Planctomycetota bacterium]